MSHPMKGWSALVAGGAILLSGCLNIDFDPPFVVKGPRILGIAAEPPEVAFGQDVLFEVLAVDADGSDLTRAEDVELRWTVCLSAREVINASGLGFAADVDDTCAEGGDDLIRLETGGELPPGTARLPGSAFLALVQDLMMGGAGGAGGQAIDPQLAMTLATVIAEVGVPLRVRVEVWRGGELLMAGFKRFAITQREGATTNPPAPRFSVGDAWLTARDGDDVHACAPEASAPVVEAGAEIVLSPADDEETWIETYPVVGLDGALQTAEEGAYYSWFSTGGTFSDEVTQAPLRDVTWTAPEEPGVYPLWVVVRDGHLGSSWCRADVAVE